MAEESANAARRQHLGKPEISTGPPHLPQREHSAQPLPLAASP